MAGNTPTRKELHAFIKTFLSEDVEAIYTDEYAAYGNLGPEFGTRHRMVNHRKEEYVRGDVHTNSIEGAWALFKRGLNGSYHWISRKHLERYLDEFEFRFNNRDNPFIFRDALIELVRSEPLEYAELVGA